MTSIASPAAMTASAAGRVPAALASVRDASFAVRVRTLLRSRPVAELNASAQWGDRFPDTDATVLALAAVDLVIARQGLPDEITYEDAVDALTQLSVLADPVRDFDEHTALARHVLDNLLNKDHHQARFVYKVGNYTPSGYERTLLEFWLLREREDRATGRIVLHADSDAINALVSGLSIDVGDEQAAAELVLRRQIARGDFGQAEATAARSYQLTVQYAEQIDQLLAETRRDIRAAAPLWEVEVPARLQAAREHLNERLTEEDRLLEHLREVIDSAPIGAGASANHSGPAATEAVSPVGRSEMTAAANRAVRFLGRCRERHLFLLHRVMEANDVFLNAQREQSFRPLSTAAIPDLHDGVLRPLLAASVIDAERAGARFLSSLSVHPRPIPRLVDLASDLLAPPRQEEYARSDADGTEEGEDDDPTGVPPEVVAAAQDLVRQVGLPARLSDLLAAVDQYSGASGSGGRDRTEPVGTTGLAELLTAAALWLYAPEESGSAQESVAAQIFGLRALAASDGTVLPRSWGPASRFFGDDLLVVADEDQLFALLPPVEPSDEALQALGQTLTVGAGVGEAVAALDEEHA